MSKVPPTIVTGRIKLAGPLVLMLGIYGLSSIPGPEATQRTFLGLVPPPIQNLLHIPLYALLSFAWLWALEVRHRARLGVILVAGMVSVSWGILDEIHQYFTPGRYASLTDILLNCMGVGIGIWFYRRLSNFR